MATDPQSPSVRGAGAYDDVVIGRKRPTGNPIIGRYEVGRSLHARLSPHYDDPMWTYGMPVKRDAEGAGEVVLSWRAHSNSPPPKGGGDKDFVRMNKQAARAGVMKGIRHFRDEHDMRVPKTRLTKDRSLPRAVRDQAMVYGHKTKEEVSVGDLISNRFESEWIEQQRALETREAETRAARKANKRERRVCMHRPPKDAEAAMHPKEYFTLKRFRDVKAKVKLPHAHTPDPAYRAGAGVRLPPISATPEPYGGESD